jgi:hypothetical protein
MPVTDDQVTALRHSHDEGGLAAIWQAPRMQPTVRRSRVTQPGPGGGPSGSVPRRSARPARDNRQVMAYRSLT